MTPFASVALVRRGDGIVFKPPRKERPNDITQARKAASRYWPGRVAEGDSLLKIFLIREYAGRLEISERGSASTLDNPWVEYTRDIQTAAQELHLAACLDELGIDPTISPAVIPDVLTINGHTYRRDI